MAIPDFQTLMRPVLEVHADGLPHSTSEVREQVAKLVGVTADDLMVPLPSGNGFLFANRVAWAVTHLAQAALLARTARGITQITDRGRQVLHEHPGRIDVTVLSEFPEYVEFRNRTRQRRGHTPSEQAPSELNAVSLTPREAIVEMIETAHSAVAAELLERILAQPPDFLEHLVLRLLVKMGYGDLERATQHLGGTGDAGLDGLVRLDPLGLDVVYVQAKRYTDKTVGRPEIQAFVGALHGAQASRGIFITTSRFSSEAIDYAERVNARIILIDGADLANLMIKHDCGVVTEETYTLKRVDENFFAEP